MYCLYIVRHLTHGKVVIEVIENTISSSLRRCHLLKEAGIVLLSSEQLRRMLGCDLVTRAQPDHIHLPNTGQHEARNVMVHHDHI